VSFAEREKKFGGIRMKKILNRKLLVLLVITSIIGVGITSAVTSQTSVSTKTSVKSTDHVDTEYDKLTGEWWQWATSIPVSANPIVDTSGVDCMAGQRGPIWFIGGTFGGGSAIRKCSIPADKKLFLPVINSVNVNTPNVCGQGPGDMSVGDLRSQVAPFIDNATKLSVLVDGKTQTMSRVKSDVFDVVLPEDNIFDGPCGSNVPAGVYSPAIDDGYYVMLNPLSAGPHSLKIHAESGSFNLDVKYDLNVVPVKLK
jgi:hypothetical protein